MKVVILHGTDADHTNNWFPWLKEELEKIGYEVWVPDLPGADHPNVKRYNDFLLNSGWDFNDNLIIGHSSGAVEALALLEAIPQDTIINTTILVGVFKGGLGWEALKELNDLKFNYEKLKSKTEKFIVVHSDNDPHCPLEGAREIAKDLDAEFVLFPGMQHFSAALDPSFTKFPELLEIIKEKIKP